MKNYELVCILDPQLGDTNFEELIEKYENHLKSNGAEVSHIDRWGLRKLAYSSVSLKRRRQGYYVLYQFVAEPALLTPLEQILKLDEGILRYLVTAVQGEFLRVPQLAPDSEILRTSRTPQSQGEAPRPPAERPNEDDKDKDKNVDADGDAVQAQDGGAEGQAEEVPTTETGDVAADAVAPEEKAESAA